MMQIDKSWEFLYEFYLDDPSSIAELINQALGVKSKKKVRTDSWDVFFEDIISSLPKNSGDKTTYEDFLDYVVDSADCKIIDEQENTFINFLGLAIITKLSAIPFFSKKSDETVIPTERLPYLILYSLGIEKDWFLYRGDPESYITKVAGKDDDNKNKQSFIYGKLYDIINKLLNVHKLKQFIYKFHREKISREQLYPLMVLLIVLRREWECSKKVNYINLKITSLLDLPSVNKKDILYALIFELYMNYEDKDKDILDAKDDIIKKIITDAKEQRPNISTINIKIHRLVAKHIIESKSFLPLFDPDIKLSIAGDNRKKEIIDNYRGIEEKLGNNYSGKRLLVDYLFPITEVRENDVFVSSSLDPLTDQIYLSLMKGKDYKKYWRDPVEGELFDWIQLQPPINSSSGEYNDNDLSIIGYRGNLKPSGEFLFVWPEENDSINAKLKKAFSDFRHDLKDYREAVSFFNELKIRLIDTSQYTQDILKTIIDVELFLNNPTDQSTHNRAIESIRWLDNNTDIRKYVNNEDFGNEIFEILDIIETYSNIEPIESLESVFCHIMKLRRMLVEAFSNSLSRCIDQADFLEDSYSTICDYINIAGVDEFEKKDDVELGIFLKDYIKHATLNAKRAELVPPNVDKECTIKSSKVILKVILNSIVDNAYKHGFTDDYHCVSPKIKFVLQESGDYVLLKICNNGKPIEISEDEYKTKGVFRGPTGHTGLGGYQISKYAEQLGGYVKIPKEEEREWNTEIHLYLKK